MMFIESSEFDFETLVPPASEESLQQVHALISPALRSRACVLLNDINEHSFVMHE